MRKLFRCLQSLLDAQSLLSLPLLPRARVVEACLVHVAATSTAPEPGSSPRRLCVHVRVYVHIYHESMRSLPTTTTCNTTIPTRPLSLPALSRSLSVSLSVSLSLSLSVSIFVGVCH